MPGNIDIEKEGAGGPETGLCGDKLAEEVMEKEAAKSRPKLGYFLKPKKEPEPEPERTCEDAPEEDEEAQEIINDAENIEEILDKEDNSALQSAFRAYSLYLRKYPRVTPEREKELGRLIQNGTPEESEAAFKELTEANLTLVVACARRMSEKFGTGNDSILDYLDMIQEGNLGLMTAVSKFNPEVGTRFSTYGVIWIRNAIERAMYKHKQAFTVPGYAGASLYTLSSYIRMYLEGKESEIPQDKLNRVKELAAIARTPVYIDQLEDPATTGGIVSPEYLNASDGEETEDESVISQMGKDAAMDVIHKAFLATFTEEEYYFLCKRHGMGYFSSAQPSSIKSLAQDAKESIEYIRQELKYIEDVMEGSRYLREVWGDCNALS